MAPKAKAIPQREVEIQENGKTRIITVYANQKVTLLIKPAVIRNTSTPLSTLRL